MSDRYFTAQPVSGDHARLEGPEAHHLLHVMRGKAGDEVVLFDGSGAEFNARIESTSRSAVELAVLSRTVIDRECPREIVIGVALPRGDRQKFLVEKLTELGAHRLVPLETVRGVAQPQPSALERLRRSVIEASKQCGRNRQMTIDTPQSVGTFASSAPLSSQRWFAHPGGGSLANEIRSNFQHASESQSLWIAVGPEGGFSDEEVAQALGAGWKPISLGSRILRVETAATALVAAAALLAE